MDNRRYYGLDALRGAMMMLGIVLHGFGFYLVSPPAGLPADRDTTVVADAVFHFIHSFRMPLFFVLAGFFAALLVDRRGMGGMYRDRAARIVAPLLAAIVVVLPPTMLFTIDFLVSVRYGAHALLPERALVERLAAEMKAAGLPTDQVSIGHLWFLYYLCYFYLMVPVARVLVEASRVREVAIQRLLATSAAPALMALWSAATLWPFRGGQLHDIGVLFLRPHLPALVYYGSFFFFGYALLQYRAALPSFARLAPAAAALSAVLFPLSLYASHLEASAGGAATGFHAAAVLTHGLCTWALIYAFLGGALRLFDRESPWTLYASQSAYWVYLVHMPFVCFAAWMLAPHALPGLVKALAAIGFTTVMCFTTYHYLVQRTWVSRLLNGRRFALDWPWRPRPLDPEAVAGTPR